jgi:hypothetical protein
MFLFTLVHASQLDGLNSPRPLANFYTGYRAELVGMNRSNLAQPEVLIRLALRKQLDSRLSANHP